MAVLRIKRWRNYTRGDEVPEELAARYPHLVEAKAEPAKPTPPVEVAAPQKQQQKEAN
jgi:hypothetical protein